MVQEVKTLTNELISWEAKKTELEESIADINEEIKLKTETERAKKKSYTSDLKATKWKIAQILESIREETEAGNEVTGTITLDDFDVEGRKLDMELVKGEMKEAQEDEE